MSNCRTGSVCAAPGPCAVQDISLTNLSKKYMYAFLYASGLGGWSLNHIALVGLNGSQRCDFNKRSMLRWVGGLNYI